VVVAIATVITLLFLTSLFEQLPETTLAAVVVAALVELVDWRSLRRYYRLWSDRLAAIYGPAARADFIAAMAALLGVLIFDTLPGLFIGIGVSVLLLLYRASRPHVAVIGRIPGTTDQFGDLERNPADEQIPGLVILRPESGLFFANADRIREVVREAAGKPGIRTVILDLETVPSVDLTAIEMLARLIGEIESSGRSLIIAHDIGQVREILRIEGRDEIRVYPTVAQAVDAATVPAGSGSSR
jgi:anti-anti-sigma factor